MKYLLLVLLLVTLTGCDRKPAQPEPPKSVFKIPDGLPEDRHIRITQETHTGGSTETAKGQGAGLTASGDKASAKDIDASAPSTQLPGGIGSSGGTFSGDLSAITESGGKFGLFAIGGLFLAASAFGIYRRWPMRAIVGLGACGAACIVAGLLSTWTIVLIAGAGLVAAACWLWSEAHGHAATSAATASARAIENVTDDTTRQAIKADIRDYAGTAKASVERVVGKIKRQYQLKSEKDRKP